MIYETTVHFEDVVYMGYRGYMHAWRHFVQRFILYKV